MHSSLVLLLLPPILEHGGATNRVIALGLGATTDVVGARRDKAVRI